ncbi:Myb-like DNA-binding domain containing protein [Trichomonas vaginalis G3]|uniref:Myb-like DNA-binding domain containing protein n=1 Tax=Trichomonas vaginalis (strain ATCC PRA-98 / G3) TaxID=412133 RepID=A2FC58_TRIV3|nr:RNA polymerase II transcription regulator recruiting protein [Trichomonas vaginalis G3]EAX97515.1 Myb-like DNA-binding domain containing protein [Trichomonas vaginalis G3]KAI5505537.1 RNA polymerase II transcription regulator recruiting protein [Trichomonas vaginalis G3]|eukprot:XP_001310445.1 Myb-like DNA-binding domain containing protein [Trichomonas vaginalis G3]
MSLSSGSQKLRFNLLMNQAQQNHLIRNKFTKDEDEKLKSIMRDFMEHKRKIDWDAISKLMKTKKPRQCKDRWFYYLDDHIDHTPFTPWENYILLWSINNIGKKWTQISTLFPRRTDVIIKLQYRKLLRRNATLQNVMEVSTSTKLNRCDHNLSSDSTGGEEDPHTGGIMDLFDKEVDHLSQELFESQEIKF